MLIKKPFKKGSSNAVAPYYKVAGGGGSATTWNPSDKSASLALSGGNLIATAGANNVGVRSIASVVTNQKVYMEYVPTVNANNQMFGFANATFSLGGVPQINACGFKLDGHYFSQGSADDNIATSPTWATGNRVGIAYDDAAKRIWLRVNGGAWSNSGDPAAGTNGYAVATTGTLFACVSIAFSTEVTTANFSSATWVDAAPSGYTQLA